MKKGYKKFTVPFEGTYFDGGKIFGQHIIFAENAEAATKKVQATFDCRNDEPIIYACKAHKWVYGDKSDSKIYPFW